MRAKCVVNSKVHYSSKQKVTYGTPQGSCLDPLLFLVFCNDLHLNLKYTKCILFADDTTVYFSSKNVSLLMASIEHNLNTLNDWFKANKLTLNKTKSVCMFYKANPNKYIPPLPDLKIKNTPIQYVDNTKFLGIWIDKHLNWNTHVNKLALKIQRNAQLIYRSKNLLSDHAKRILYYAQIYSHISYGIGVWGPMTPSKGVKNIHKIQKKCLKCLKSTEQSPFLLIKNIIDQEIIKFGWKITNHKLPISLEKCALSTAHGASLIKDHGYQTRNKKIPNVLHVKNKSSKNSIFCKCITLFGNLLVELKNVEIYKVFCKQLKHHLLEKNK